MFTTILCIEDDPIALMLCKKVISRFNFSENIVTAVNGQDALHFFNNIKYEPNALENRPQLILLDLNMPIMGGWDFLDHFTQNDYQQFNNIPVVILSSTIDPEDLSKAKEYPLIVDFLSKPINSDMLNYLSKKLSKLQQ